LARCVRAALVRRCVLAAAGSVLALGVAAAGAAGHGRQSHRTGALRLDVSGLPADVAGALLVSGAHSRGTAVVRSTLLRALAPGVYRVKVRAITLRVAEGGVPAGSVIERCRGLSPVR
jgi:hypothetical protein